MWLRCTFRRNFECFGFGLGQKEDTRFKRNLLLSDRLRIKLLAFLARQARLALRLIDAGSTDPVLCQNSALLK